MRDHARPADADLLALRRTPRTVDAGASSLARATLDLQRTAGNRSVAALVARDARGARSIPAIPGVGATLAGAAATAPALQREPCSDCPDASAGPPPAAEVGQESVEPA